MKELVLFVSGETVGPFSIEDVKARFAAGELTSDTPCAEPGATEWKRLGDVVGPAGASPVRLARKTREEVAEMKSATSEKLDPEIRKKLLLYNLADAISVDKFTPVQAEAAIAVHEAALKKGKKLKIAAGVGGFLVAFGLASFLFNCVNIGTAPGGRGLKLFEKCFIDSGNPEYVKTLKRVQTDAARLADLRAEVAAVKFNAPRSQGDPRQTFLGFVQIKNPDISTVSGTLLVPALPQNLADSASFEIIQVKRLDSDTEALIKKQNELFALLVSPLWGDRELREAIVEKFAKDLSADADVPECAELIKLLKAFRTENTEVQLQNFSARVSAWVQNAEIRERGQGRANARKKASDKNAAANDAVAAGKRSVEWVKQKLPKFFENFKAFLAEKELYYSAAARKKAWGDFVQNDLPKIRESLDANAVQQAVVSENGAFILDGRNKRNLVALAKLSGAGDVYFIPQEESEASENAPAVFRNLKDNRRVLTPEDVLMNERYRVAAKEKTGGVPVFASSKLLAREVFIVRTTPEWFYVTVEKVSDENDTARRKPSVLLGVPAEFYESVAVGDEVPMEKLLTFERFGRLAESSAGGRLTPIPDDKLEVVKEQQEEAGIAFPPPPEKVLPPEEAKPEAPSVEPQESVPAEGEAPDASSDEETED